MHVTNYPAKRDEEMYQKITSALNRHRDGSFHSKLRKAFPELLYFSNDVGQGEARNNAYAWNLDIEKPLPFSNQRLFKGKDFEFFSLV